jgi:hypothetical protein
MYSEPETQPVLAMCSGEYSGEDEAAPAMCCSLIVLDAAGMSNFV